MEPAPRRTHAAAILVLIVGFTTSCATGTTDAAGDPPKIGFILVGARDDLGYNQAVWEGADEVAKAFPNHEVLRLENVPETDAAEDAMEDLIDRGARILFATSFGHYAAAVKVARGHDDVIVVHQGATDTPDDLPNFGTYFGAHYEPLYLSGIAAGAATSTGVLGFAVAFPIPATFNNVNAFTLGARSVNPSVVTRVAFTGNWCDPDAQRRAVRDLREANADVIAQHQDCTRTILEETEAAGLKSVGYHADGSEVAPNGWLAGAVWVWGDLYKEIVDTALDGTFTSSRFNGNVRRGLAAVDDPLVFTELGPGTPPIAAELIDSAFARFRQGDTPFTGPIVDRDGKERVAGGDRLSIGEIDAMDWFVEGVEGDIPDAPPG
ncbi:MAG TPA: BMP family ABC transporter substrate-binding protein [Acidimicrobiia bacterium]|nr:BMP family ABC transporter substrate-binding protein [Acidimicrobiia bacterium]